MSFFLIGLAGSMGACLVSQSSHLNNAFFYQLPAGLFPFFIFSRRAFIFQFWFCGPFFINGHACRRVSSASAAQHSAISPAQSSKASTCRSELDNAIYVADIQSSWREPASRLPFTQLAVFSPNERRNRNLPGLYMK